MPEIIKSPSFRRLETFRSLLNVVTVLLCLDTSILLVPTITLCTASFVRLNWLFKSLSFILVIMTPLELYVHNLLTFDIEYLRQNMYQGRSYQIHTTRVLCLWFLSIVAGVNKQYYRYTAALILNLSHFVLSIILISLMYKHDNNMNKPTFAKVFVLMLSLYLAESMI